MDLTETFAAISNATLIAGVPDAWFWCNVPQASKYASAAVLSKDRKHAFQCYAHNSYDEGLARAIVAFAREHDAELIAPSERPLVVVEGFGHPGYGFDMLVAVSPTVHKYHAAKPDIHRVTRAVFPAYRCEFSGAETQDQAWYRYTVGAGAKPTMWNREPSPYLRMRMRTATGREIRKRGFAHPLELVHELTELSDREGGFVEFENYQRRVWAATSQETYLVTEGQGEPRQMDLDTLVEFTKQVLYGPNRSSGESAFVKYATYY